MLGKCRLYLLLCNMYHKIRKKTHFHTEFLSTSAFFPQRVSEGRKTKTQTFKLKNNFTTHQFFNFFPLR